MAAGKHRLWLLTLGEIQSEGHVVPAKDSEAKSMMEDHWFVHTVPGTRAALRNLCFFLYFQLGRRRSRRGAFVFLFSPLWRTGGGGLTPRRKRNAEIKMYTKDWRWDLIEVIVAPAVIFIFIFYWNISDRAGNDDNNRTWRLVSFPKVFTICESKEIPLLQFIFKNAIKFSFLGS